MDFELEDIRKFNEKMGFESHITVTRPTRKRLRERALQLQEEAGEFVDAVEEGSMVDMADALIDLVYFAKGTAILMGLPWEELWQIVQECNMKKEFGKTKRGIEIDAKKPEDWVGPADRERHTLLLNGWDGKDGWTNQE